MDRIPISGFVGAGVIIGGLFFVFSFLTAFGICSDTTIAERLFPFAFLVDPSLFQRPLLALVLALIQYPLYGVALRWIWPEPNFRVFGLILLLAIHIAAASVAKIRVSTMWQQKFSQMDY